MSALIWRSASGRWTLTTTSWPPGSRAACTWPMDAEAIGTSSKYSKTCSTWSPSSAWITPRIRSKGSGWAASCRPRSSWRMSGGTTSGRVESSWPNLTNVGPSSSSISRIRRPRLRPDPALVPVLLAAPEGVAEPVTSRHVGDLTEARKVLPPLSSRHAGQGISGAGRGPGPRSGSLGGSGRVGRGRLLEQRDAVLQLHQPEVDVLQLGARDHPELAQHALHAALQAPHAGRTPGWRRRRRAPGP